MKQTIDLIYRRTATGQSLCDKEGNPVRVEEILSRVYRLKPGRIALVRLRADDGMHERLDFDMETLRAIQGRKIKGAFSTRAGQKVSIYNSSLKGPWPIIGATCDGIGLRWDADGNPDNGDPGCRLCLFKETEPDTAFLDSHPVDITGEAEMKTEPEKEECPESDSEESRRQMGGEGQFQG